MELVRTKSNGYWEMLGGQRSENFQTEDNVGSDLLSLTSSKKNCEERLDLPVPQAVGVPGSLRAKCFPSRQQQGLVASAINQAPVGRDNFIFYHLGGSCH